MDSILCFGDAASTDRLTSPLNGVVRTAVSPSGFYKKGEVLGSESIRGMFR